MLSQNTKKNITKGLVCVAVTGQLLSVPVNVYAVNNSNNPITAQTVVDTDVLQNFVTVGCNVFAGGNEYINAFTKCKEFDRFTTPFLPINGRINSVSERLNPRTGKLMQRRIYNEDGIAEMDIDFTSHGATNSSARDVHIHMWKDGKRTPARQLTKDEYVKYVMIPRGYTGYDKIELTEEIQSIPITYDNFRSLLIQNHEIKFEINNSIYNIAYSKDKDGSAKYFLTRLNQNLLAGTIDQYKFYSKREILEGNLYYRQTLNEIWDNVTVLEIY